MNLGPGPELDNKEFLLLGRADPFNKNPRFTNFLSPNLTTQKNTIDSVSVLAFLTKKL